MAAQRTSFEKLQRDRAKKAKAAAKREKRLEKSRAKVKRRRPPSRRSVSRVSSSPPASCWPGWRRSIASSTRRRSRFEDFEEQKADLMARISVD